MPLDAQGGAPQTPHLHVPEVPSAVQTDVAFPLDLEAVFARARPRLLQLARRHGMHADVAEDIAQESLLTAWSSLSRLRHPAQLDAWLDGICRNLCLRAQRAAASTRTLSESDLIPTRGEETEQVDPLASIPDETQNLLDMLTRHELTTLVERALGHLSTAARAVVELRYLAELPTDEAAARLGMSVNTLQVRLSRARKQLHTVLHGPLREDAIACGLLLAPADETGWRDTRLWCHVCGQDRLQGLFETASNGGRRMRLRCPHCWRTAGAIEADVDAPSGLDTLKTFRSAFKRLMQMGMVQLLPALRSPMRCSTCGMSIQTCVTPGRDLQPWSAHSRLYHDRFFVTVRCPNCGLTAAGAGALAGLRSPEVERFMATHERWIVESEAAIDFRGHHALHFLIRDRTTGDRITYVADAHTLDVQAVLPA
jgi:RNA polymerase sigma factor (sigma-70 family)